MFLTLSSNQSNCSKRENEISWSMPNLDLGCNQFVGLSSAFFTFEGGDNDIYDHFELTTNLIDRNNYNQAGILLTIAGQNAALRSNVIKNVQRAQIEFWKLDSRKPKNLTFTFRHFNRVNTKKNVTPENATITLAFSQIQDAAQSMVRKEFIL